MKYLFAFLLMIGSALAQTCTITSDATPPAVNEGGTHQFTTSCPSPTWSVVDPYGGSIDSSTGIYTAPATVWAQDVSRGWQLLPNSSVYKLPVNSLSVDSRSSYWMQRIADQGACPGSGCIPAYHNFKLAQPGVPGFYDNTVNSSTPTQLMHFVYSGSSIPWQDTSFPYLLPPNVFIQSGFSQDWGSANEDHHTFSINSQTGDDAELYNAVIDYKTFVITAGSPTTITYTTNSIRTLQNPIRVYIAGITGTCSNLNGNYLATVVSQTPGTGGTLTVPVSTSGNCALGSPSVAGTALNCSTCNAASGMHWTNVSNAITGGTDAAGSPISASSAHSEEWWNVVQKNILDPACNCVTLGHALRTTLANSDISPRNLWPSILGNGVTTGHPNIGLTAAVRGSSLTTFTANIGSLATYTPCSGYTYTVGCTFPIVISNMGTGWTGADGPWTATAVDNTHFTIALNSSGFPASFPSGSTFIFDWLPYGGRMRLKSSFNVAGFCSNASLTDKCPYEKAILNTLQVYGLILLDGTIPGANWQSGLVASEYDPDPLQNAAVDLGNNVLFGGKLQTGGGIEQYMEVVDESGQQIDFTPYTNPLNMIGLTANNRVTVTAAQSGYTSGTIDAQLQGAAVGTDRERISMVSGTTYQINAWLSGITGSSLSYAMSPPVSGAGVSGTGLITAPSTLSAVTETTVTITSSADSTANAYIDVYFIPVSPDGNIRLDFGQQGTSYVDTLGNTWWGQVVNRSFNSSYEIADGTGFANLNGTWICAGCAASWNSTTTDAQLYAQSTSSVNDTNLFIVVPNATYTATLRGEPGYGTTASGQNVYDAEINGTVASSYNDGWTLSGSAIHHGYSAVYPGIVISNGILQFNGRIRELPGSYGMSLSSLMLAPGGCALDITTASLPGGTIGVPYSQTLAAICGQLPYTWSLSSGSLPTGLSLSSAGVISGTPSGSPGTASFVVEVTDSLSNTATQPLSITIGATISISPAILPNGNAGVAYSQQMIASGGSAPYTWSISSGSLPTSLSINAATGISGPAGLIYGTPSVTGLFSFTVKATDKNGTSGTSPLSILILAAPPTGVNGMSGGVTMSGSGNVQQ